MPDITTADAPQHHNLFQRDPFLACWQQHLAPKFEIVHQHGPWVLHRKPVMDNPLGQLIKLHEVRLGGWNASWYQGVSPEDVDELATLLRQHPWDVVRWDSIETVQPSQGLQAIQQLAAQHGYLCHQWPESTIYAMDLSAGYEAMMAQKSREARRNVKRRFTAAQKDGITLRLNQTTDIDAFFTQFCAWHIPYWQSKEGGSYLSDPREQDFLVAWAQALQAQGQLRLEEFWMNDTLVNLSTSIIEGNQQYWLLTINSGDFADYGPGILALHLRIQQAIADGKTIFNMGYGDYPYKKQAANQEHPRTINLLVNPASPLGRLSAWRLSRSLTACHKAT